MAVLVRAEKLARQISRRAQAVLHLGDTDANAFAVFIAAIEGRGVTAADDLDALESWTEKLSKALPKHTGDRCIPDWLRLDRGGRDFRGHIELDAGTVEGSVYGNLLRDLIARHSASCWLVNTGWTGGAYGTGSRMPIAATQLPATRTTILVQGCLRETMKAEAIATMTKSVVMMPISPRIPAPSFKAIPLKTP